jgi:hypothetical protein
MCIPDAVRVFQILPANVLDSKFCIKAWEYKTITQIHFDELEGLREVKTTAVLSVQKRLQSGIEGRSVLPASSA